MYLTKDVPSVESLDDLPACTDSREGDLVLLSSLNAVYVCDDGKWEKLDIDDLQEPCSSSSSSTEISSSSVEVSYGTFTDSRAGQVYKTVQTGEQVWIRLSKTASPIQNSKLCQLEFRLGSFCSVINCALAVTLSSEAFKWVIPSPKNKNFRKFRKTLDNVFFCLFTFGVIKGMK